MIPIKLYTEQKAKEFRERKNENNKKKKKEEEEEEMTSRSGHGGGGVSSNSGSSSSRTRVGKYELGRTLGEGNFAKVKFARNTETGENVAIKILDKEKVLKHKMIGQVLLRVIYLFDSMWLFNSTIRVTFINLFLLCREKVILISAEKTVSS